MKNIFRIFKTDLVNIRRNKAAIVVIVAVMILPSLYAWFNILPSWDPYANTSDVKVAIANNDKGTEIKGQSVNVGEEIINSLSENKKLGWQFVSEAEAVSGVEQGQYYASVIIPENLSEKLMSVLTGNPERPMLDYYINEKINAIAPKVTGAGASAIVENIQSGFVQVANEAIFNVFNELGLQLELNRMSIEEFVQSVFRLERDIPEIQRMLHVADDDLTLVEGALAKANEGMKKVEEIRSQAEIYSGKVSHLLTESDEILKKYVPIVKQDLEYARSIIQGIPTITEKFTGKGENLDQILSEIEQIASQFHDHSASLNQLIEQLKDANKKLIEQQNNDGLTNSLENEWGGVEGNHQATVEQLNQNIATLEAMHQELEQLNRNIVEAIEKVRAGKGNIDGVLQNIHEKSVKMNEAINELLHFVENDLIPMYENASKQVKNALQEANNMLEKVEENIPRIYELLEKGKEGVTLGKHGLLKANEVFPEAKTKIEEIAQLIRRLEEKGDLQQLIDIMKNNPTAEGEFFAHPIGLVEHELFPIPNYGSAMSPFFTTLSLWVGVLILVSSLRVDVPNKHRYRSYEAYFGRLLTFGMIGFVQTVIVTVGDMFLLKTFVVHKLLFVLFALMISVTFVTIVYTLVSVFGNTGKVLGIILLVMQLGASGGTFPIQMTPAFFQTIHTFLPFTHGLQLLREAVGGVIWPVVWRHVLVLLIYIGIFLFIGIVLKERINKSSDEFMEKARESEIVL